MIRGDNKLPRLNINVSKATLPRAFRLLQALFNALEQRGHETAANKEGKTILTVLDEALEVSLREPSKQVRHVPTSKELADAKRYSWMRPAPYDLVSSGTLVLNIENVWGTRHTWKDGKTRRLEDVLNDVVVGLIEAALHKKAQREEQERRRLRQEELERQREAARQRARQERAKVRRLERLWEAANEHQRLRAFVAQLHDVVGSVDPDTELGRWLSWADGHVNRLDPLTPFREPSPTIRLYYLTSGYAVPKILEAGFTDRDPEHGEDKELPASVTLTDTPMTRNGYDPTIRCSSTLQIEARMNSDMSRTTRIFSQWERIFKDPMATAAAIDRLVHHVVILEFDVPSFRTDRTQTGPATPPPTRRGRPPAPLVAPRKKRG